MVHGWIVGGDCGGSATERQHHVDRETAGQQPETERRQNDRHDDDADDVPSDHLKLPSDDFRTSLRDARARAVACNAAWVMGPSLERAPEDSLPALNPPRKPHPYSNSFSSPDHNAAACG